LNKSCVEAYGALIGLRHRLETLPARHADRKSMISATAAL
jgi:hypothetical protein